MALIFNSYAKGAGGFLANFRSSGFFGGGFSDAWLLIYPSTVAMPATAGSKGGVGNAPVAGAILQFTNINPNIVMSGNSIAYTGTARSATTTAAGTLSWFAICQSYSYGSSVMYCDSISLSGGGGVLVLSTLTPTNGQSVTWSGFNLTMV